MVKRGVCTEDAQGPFYPGHIPASDHKAAMGQFYQKIGFTSPFTDSLLSFADILDDSAEDFRASEVAADGRAALYIFFFIETVYSL